MEYVKDIKKEVLEYVQENSGVITPRDIWMRFQRDWQAVSFALTTLETEGKVELRVKTESIGKRYYAVDERLWRIK